MRQIIKRTNLVDRVVEIFLDKVESGAFKPGSLPSQEKLARDFNVSRVVLREALNKLETMGIVEIKHGKGTYIIEQRKQDFILQSLTSKLFFENKRNFLSILEARLIVETETAYLAAERASEEQLKQLDSFINAMATSLDDYEKFEKIDLDLHIFIAEASGNIVLKEITSFIENGYGMAPAEFFKIPGVIEKTHREHAGIVEAIKARDGKEAKKLMEAHLNFPKEILQDIKTL